MVLKLCMQSRCCFAGGAGAVYAGAACVVGVSCCCRCSLFRCCVCCSRVQDVANAAVQCAWIEAAYVAVVCCCCSPCI